jgi:hypothetical protein
MLAALAGLAGGQTYTFKYCRDSVNEFSGLTYTSMYDTAYRYKFDRDFSLKAGTARSAFIYSVSFDAWLRNHPEASLARVVVRGRPDHQYDAPGALHYTAAIWDMTPQLAIWPGSGPGADTAKWEDPVQRMDTTLLGVAPLTLGDSLVIPVPDITGQIPLPAYYDMDITPLAQYAQAHPELPFGYVFVSTPVGQYTRMVFYAFEDSPNPAGQRSDTLNMAIIAEASGVGIEEGSRERIAARGGQIRLEASPNPFRTAVGFELRAASKYKIPALFIYTASGACVARLTAHRSPLATSYSWNAACMPTGLYVARLQTGGRIITKQVMLLK